LAREALDERSAVGVQSAVERADCMTLRGSVLHQFQNSYFALLDHCIAVSGLVLEVNPMDIAVGRW
jgi:hypothetical protein